MNARNASLIAVAVAGLAVALPAGAAHSYPGNTQVVPGSDTSMPLILARRGADDGFRGGDDRGGRRSESRNDDDRGYGYGYERRQRSSGSDDRFYDDRGGRRSDDRDRGDRRDSRDDRFDDRQSGSRSGDRR